MWLYRPYNDQDQYDGEIRSDRTRASVASKLIILVEGDCFWFQPYCSHWNWYWVYVTCGISSPELTDLIQRTIRMTVESVAEWIGINVFSGVPLLSFICISSSRVQFLTGSSHNLIVLCADVLSHCRWSPICTNIRLPIYRRTKWLQFMDRPISEYQYPIIRVCGNHFVGS